MPGKHFTPDLFAFLSDLAAHNERAWFKANKERYETEVKEPALSFIEDLAPRLQKVSPHFRADPRPVGGSMFRIHRDTRFSRDKSPYKTYVGLQFRHEAGKDAHAPGFYLHLERGAVFMGCGIWRPDSATLLAVREAIVEDPPGWKRAKVNKRFREHFTLEGDALKTYPRGFDPEHPLIDDLRRKDFVAVHRMDEETVTRDGFLGEFVSLCRAAAPFQRFLCKAVGAAY